MPGPVRPLYASVKQIVIFIASRPKSKAPRGKAANNGGQEWKKTLTNRRRKRRRGEEEKEKKETKTRKANDAELSSWAR